MAQIVWDEVGSRIYETGIDHVVLYVGTDSGVPWNGITTITEAPAGGEVSSEYSANERYLSLISTEQLGGTIEAFTSPDEFEQCDGTIEALSGISMGQQNRKTFCLAYRTALGNDTDLADAGYKLHIIYNAIAAPSQEAYETMNDSPAAITMSWDFTTTAVEVGVGFKATSIVTLDSTKIDPTVLGIVEDVLYGTSTEDPAVMSPAEIIALIIGARELVYDVDTSYYDLVDGGLGDVTLSDIDGEYNISSRTRLVPTSTPGFYTLES